MATTKTKKAATVTTTNKQVAIFIGELYAFNNSLKLYHWHVTGEGSYAQHMALDQALESAADTLDRIAETSYALLGDLTITIPETKTPKNLVKHISDFFNYTDKQRDLFPENFSQAMIDDYQEALQQLLYRVVRLK